MNPAGIKLENNAEALKNIWSLGKGALNFFLDNGEFMNVSKHKDMKNRLWEKNKLMAMCSPLESAKAKKYICENGG